MIPMEMKSSKNNYFLYFYRCEREESTFLLAAIVIKERMFIYHMKRIVSLGCFQIWNRKIHLLWRWIYDVNSTFYRHSSLYNRQNVQISLIHFSNLKTNQINHVIVSIFGWFEEKPMYSWIVYTLKIAFISHVDDVIHRQTHDW